MSLRGFGPFIACALIAAKGRAWLRWVEGRGFLGFRAGGAKDSVQRRSRAAVVVLVLLFALAALPTLSWTTLFDRDEGYYAECGREMLMRRDPFVPHFNGKPWLEKPPMPFWFMALSMGVLGETEFAARLPSALAALVAIGLTFHLARRMYSAAAGAIAALVLGSSLLFAVIMRMALADHMLVCCVLAAMIGVWDLLLGERRSGLTLFYAACGLGVLAKGPLGFGLPIIALAGVLLWTRRLALLRRMQPLPGLLLAAAIVAVWAIPASWLTQGEYFWELVWVRTLEPIFTPLQGHGGYNVVQYLALLPVYVPILVVGFLPWSGLLAPATRFVTRDGWRGDRPGLLFGWPLAQLVAFSLVRTKLPHYVLPLMPPLAIACGAFLADALNRRGRLRQALTRGWRLAYVAGSFVFGAAILAAPVATGFPREWPWFLPAALVAVASGVWAARDLRRSEARAMAVSVAGWLLCLCLLWQLGLPRFESGKAPARVAHFLEAHDGKGRLGRARLAWFPGSGFHEMSLVFYVKRPVRKLSNLEDLRRFLADPTPGIVVLAEKKLQDMIRYGLDVPYRDLWATPVWIPEKNRWLTLCIVSNLISDS